MTDVITSVSGLRVRLDAARRDGSVALVPTMGALHAGHASLIDGARAQCRTVVVSIFVNPLQFDRVDDLQRYPRSLATDIELCAAHGVDVVFAPAAGEVYPRTLACTVDVGRLADHLCGPFRPGHFRGVATVVLKLLQLARPDRAYFGEKDAQQLAIVRRMVDDFNVPVTIVGVPTVRDPDGLALSSRNVRLSPEERQWATGLFQALAEACRQISDGARDPAAILAAAGARVAQPDRIRVEYLDIVDPDDMQPVAWVSGPVCVAGAVWVGSTRLIDNMLCHPPVENRNERP